MSDFPRIVSTDRPEHIDVTERPRRWFESVFARDDPAVAPPAEPPGVGTLTGHVIQRAPTFAPGVVGASGTLTGFVFTRAPSFGAGVIEAEGIPDVTVEQQASEGFGTNATSHTTTASLTLTPGKMGFVAVMPSFPSGPEDDATVTGAGQTWFKVTVANRAGVRPLQLYACIGGTGSGQITVTYPRAVDLGLVMWVSDNVDTTDPFGWIQNTGSLANSTSITIFQPDMLDPTHNAVVMGIFTGNPNGNTQITADTGFALIGRCAFPSPANYSMGVQWRLGQDNSPTMVYSPSGTFSNGGWAIELRAAGSAPRRNDYRQIAQFSTASNTSTVTITAPTYAAADPIVLTIATSRTSGTPNAPSVSGGGVTWTQRATTLFGPSNTYRLTTFTAVGPLDASNVVVTFPPTQTQETHQYWMGAIVGGGSIVQTPTATPTATTTPGVTFATPAAGSTQLAVFVAVTPQTTSQYAITPGAGWVQAQDDVVNSAGHCQGGTPLRVTTAPGQQMYLTYRQTDDTTGDITGDTSSDWAVHGIEIAA